MLRFLSGFCPLFVVLALVLVTGCGSKEDDAKKYAKSISDRNEALAEALVLYGSMVSAFHKDAKAVDSEDYVAAEETIAGYVKRIGTLEDLEKVSLPGNDEGLKLAHDYFMISVSYLYKSQSMLEESGYVQESSLMALGMWEQARNNFISFSELLNQLEGKPPLDEDAPPGDAVMSEAPDDMTPATP
jgi:hypothetical protein